ncbi:MAG: TonB-dependent receptor, partial [Lentisphaerae bacterium]|nr:TonB-dependent receptor [Lentisphaerota bacterium]
MRLQQETRRKRSVSGTRRSVTMILAAMFGTMQLLTCVPVCAQEQGEPSRLKLAPTLEEELKWLAAEGLVIRIPTVAGASRFEQQSVQAPASVAVVTRDQIQKYGHRNLGDVLRSLPGFHVNTDRVVLTLGIRGYNDPGELNTRVLILVDGHRINENIYDVASIDGSFPVDISMIDHVEVLHGPASSLYGSNAFVGVINVITRKGSDIDGVEVSATYGTFDTRKTRFTYGGTLDNGLELLLSGTLYDSRGDDPYFPERALPTSNQNGINDIERDGDYMLKLAYQDWSLQLVYGNRDKEDPAGTYSVDFNEAVDNMDTHGYADLHYAPTIGENVDVSWHLFYHHYAYEWRGKYAGSPNVVDNIGEWWGTELAITRPLLDSHKVTAGFEYRDNFRQDFEAYDEPQTYKDTTHEQSNVWALFLQDEYRILDELILNAGVRYDHYSTFGETVNPRAALIYNPFAKTVVKLLYGEAFRAPSAAEMHQDDGGFSLLPNRDLDPETARTFEAIIEQYLGDNYRLTLSAFRNTIEDALISQDVGGGLSQYQ